MLGARRITLVVASVATCVVGTGIASGISLGGRNYLSNGDAESGTTVAWAGTGWTSRPYSGLDPSVSNGYSSNTRLFAAVTPGTELEQTVPFDQDTDAIDAGRQQIVLSARLGATGPGDAGAQVTMQPLDAAGDALGAPLILGPPSAADRSGTSAVVDCWATSLAPPRTRFARVTLAATGDVTSQHQALADTLHLTDEYLLVPIFTSSVSYPGDGPNCYRTIQYVIPTPTPAADPSPAPQASPTPEGATPTPAPSSTPPWIAHLRLTATRLAFTRTSGDRLTVRIDRHTRTVRSFTVKHGQPGRVSHRIRRLHRGRYKVELRSKHRRETLVARVRLR